MDDRQRRIIEALGLRESDFSPSLTDSERMNEIENAVLELADIVGEVVANG